jgi:polygalacturonase
MSANIKASVDGTQAIIGVGGVDQMTVSNAGVVTANSFVGNVTSGGTFSGNASSATALATGSITSRTLADRFDDFVNVKDFGAVGNWNATTGTGTDDSGAIQDAIDSLGQNGGTVYIPNGMKCLVDSNMMTFLM